jgi:hypothetical protein
MGKRQATDSRAMWVTSLTADHHRGSINAPNVMLCMPIGCASGARAANAFADAANCSNAPAHL